MKTELILFHRPNNGLLNAAIPIGTASTDWSARSGLNYGSALNPNKGNTIDNMQNRTSAATGLPDSPIVTPISPSAKSGQGTRIDLYDDIDIPITYNILDISDPDKRKTAWSKTVKIPGTKGNNRTFSHLYQISGDGWVKIGNTSVYQNFNPNLKTEIILLSDGIQVLKGNLQVKSITKDAAGNVEYNISLTGDLTSLFFDVGTAKLNDLDFSEWNHDWTRTNVENSWVGSLKKNNLPYSNVTLGTPKIVKYMFVDNRGGATMSTGRLGFETTTAHGLAEGEFVKNNVGGWNYFEPAVGTWCVAEVLSSTRFTVNTPFPMSLYGAYNYNNSTGVVDVLSYNPPYGIGNIQKVSCDGTGYVYPLVSWGDELDQDSFPVTSMAPSYFMKEIWDKIFDKINSKYQSNFLNSEMFKRLIVTQKKATYEVNPAEILRRGFLVGSDQERTTKANPVLSGFIQTWTASAGATAFGQITAVGGTIPQILPFWVEGGDYTSSTGSISFYDGIGATNAGPAGNWNTSTNKWKVASSAQYGLSCNITLESWVDMNGDANNFQDGTASFIDGLAPVTSPGYGYDYVEYYTGNKWNSPYGPPQMRVRMMLNRKKPTQTNSTETEIGRVMFEMPRDIKFTPLDSFTSIHIPDAATLAAGMPFFGRFQPKNWKTGKQLNGSITDSYFTEGEEVWITLRYDVLQAPGSGYNVGSSAFYRKVNIAQVDGGNNFTGYWGYTEDINTDWYIRVKGWRSPYGGALSILKNEPSAKSTEGSAIFGREFLPKDMTCKDFLKNVIKMFNLHIEPDRNIERLYYIEPRDDYYYTGSNGSTDYTDWTDKLDADSVEIVPMGQLLAKNYIFSNKAETDYWNKKFKEERGRDYSSYTKEINNDFLKNDFKIDIGFGTTVMINQPENSDVVIPAVHQRESNGTVKPVSNSLPRVLFWVGLRPFSNPKGNGLFPNTNPLFGGAGSGYYGWELISSNEGPPVIAGGSATSWTYSRHHYPYAGTVDSPQDPYYDLNWFNMEEGDFVYYDYARWSNHNLYNVYWKNFIDEVSDPSSMVVRGDFNLSPKDIYNLDFRRIFVVDGVYYRLQKIIDYNPIKDGLTKVELLKLKQPTRFKRTSKFYYDTFETIADISRPITTTWVVAPPRTRKSFLGDFNNTLPANLGNGTIQVTGLANYVGPGKNIVVNGNENHVGHGSNNIHIASGNGVVIGSGIKNVNIIGTNNVNVQEDNVTYINNIRYKDGVSVSRCNIIDGGETSATASQVQLLRRGRNVNTTINVVDAGEDDVIHAGTSTHENVINGGSDAILPDLVELGLTTRTTPNPRTNYTGGADFYSATASLTEIVRANRQNTQR